jgi:hypothetical protein
LLQKQRVDVEAGTAESHPVKHSDTKEMTDIREVQALNGAPNG